MANSKEQRLKVLRAKREQYFSRVQQLYDCGKKTKTSNAELNNFRIRFKTLEDTKNQYLQVVDEINIIKLEVDPNEVPSFQCLEAFDQMYCHILEIAEQIASSTASSSEVSVTAREGTPQKNIPRLPQLELPSFSGKIKDWPIFYECFKSLIHDNQSLNNVDKIHYLIGKLSDRALTVCAGIPPIGENYEIIWQALVDQFQDQRSLANNYLEQMLEFKPASSATASSLNNFLEKFDAASNALKKLEISDLSDFIFSYLALSKLDSETRGLFENTRRKSTIPTYKEILDFVKEQAKIYTRSQSSTKSVGSSSGNKMKPTQSFLVANNKIVEKCSICNITSHPILNCSKFLENTPSERYKIIKQRNLCLNCFGTHRVVACRSKLCCKICRYKHNTLLHFNKSQLSSNANVPRVNNIPMQQFSGTESNDISVSKNVNGSINDSLEKSNLLGLNSTNHIQGRPQISPGLSNIAAPATSSFCSTTNATYSFNSTVLLSTVVVNVFSKNGEKHRVRFLLDSCSQAHFLTIDCAKRLKLDISKWHSAVSGIGQTNNYIINGKANIVISSRFNPNNSYSMEVLLVEKITDQLPSCTVYGDSLSHIVDLPLADDTFNRPGKIDGVIGAELFPLLLGKIKIQGPPHSPIALETSFGYVVMGSAPIRSDSEVIANFCIVLEPSLEMLVSKFWELENIPSQAADKPEDLECEVIYKSNYCREPSGRYSVSLPFRHSPSKLGDSYSTALKRFLFLENKFRRNPEFKIQYTTVINEYLKEGYMSKINDNNSSLLVYHIPHHAVCKVDSPSTPLRCVFDASAKSTTSLSLNDLLYTGPKLQTDIVTVLLNFRLFEIAFTADIRKMYLQINLHNEHKRFQRILWRFSEDEPIDIYELNTVSFGVKSSPYLAIRTVHQLVIDEEKNYPLAAAIVKRDFYMDDLVTSISSLEQAKILYEQLVGLFKAGCFDLIKWSVNSKELLQYIPKENLSPKVVDFETDTLKILGLQWRPSSDVLAFKVKFENRVCNKRNILSIAARLFDPLGFIAPIILWLKLLIKELWKLKIDWDDPPPSNIENKWTIFQSELPLLNNFKINRHLGIFENSTVVLIGFSDACLTSYGGVVYVRTINNGKVETSLLCAKSRVSPMKILSIPRLELCAAYLLAKLLHFIVQTYKSRIHIEKIFAFSDSTVTLHWICSPSYKWETFVANRVSKIQELVPPNCWFHVEGKENICDCLSRGLLPAQFMANTTWGTGPTWLQRCEVDWPIRSVDNYACTSLEVKVFSVVISNDDLHPLNLLVNRCSSWTKLLRSTVYVLRFARVLPSKGTISISDLDKAEMTLLKLIQSLHFPSEIALLEKTRLCSASLRSLCPFLKDGLIRVGGRLSNSKLEYDHQHPFLLPKKDHLVDLIIDHCHRENLHTGPHLVLSILRQKYWILAARGVVRNRIKKCNYCFRFCPKPTFPLMADLPAFRVTEAKAFLYSGVDYAGPYMITLGRRRGIKSQKAYICLFICLSTKALHLELASSLSTETFLAAFKRFLSRRGACAVMYSDCGTNFIGAKTALDSIYNLVHSDEYNGLLANELIQYKIDWRFQPPTSPHFSGIWEANVKAVKSHLAKVVGSQILSYEEMSTVLTQIEALLNSRPLCWLSSDPSEPLALTPAHFLTLTPLKHLPAPDLANQSPNVLNRKELLDHLVQSFWKRWHVEYLHHLQLRQKWNTPSCPIKVGTLVIIRQDNAPPLYWPLGIIEEVFPGRDGVIRVANVKTKTGIYKRPVVRLCPLPSQ